MKRNPVKRWRLMVITVFLTFGLICPPTIAAGYPTPAIRVPETGGRGAPVLPEAFTAPPALPLFFTKNQGELPIEVQYYARGAGMTILVTRRGISLLVETPRTFSLAADDPPAVGPGDTPGKQVRSVSQIVPLTPLGMSRSMQLDMWRPLPGKVNLLTGRDRRHWRTGLTPGQGVIFRNAYPGIDLIFYGQGQQLEYDVVVRPGANPRQVKFQYSGVSSISTSARGDLHIILPKGGVLTQKKPVVYQEIAGQRVRRAGDFRILTPSGPPTYSFALSAYDPRYPLVIDPIVEYSTYLGGSGPETVLGQAMTVDAQSNIYLVGTTGSADLLTDPSSYQGGLAGGYDVFVAKFNAKGALVFTTYLGGLCTDFGQGIVVDHEGQVYVTGYTASDNFPIVNPLPGGDVLKGGRGNYDAFVAKLSADGSSLLFSSFLGGTGRDHAFGLALDQERHVYVVGATTSSDFPTTSGAYQATKPGPEGDFDAFIAKLNLSTQTITYATYLGGSLWDLGYGISVDAQGNAYVIGTTFSADLAAEPLRPFSGAADAFVARIAADGASLDYLTYLGGSDQDEGSAIVVDAQGQAFVTGGTRSPDFFTRNPWQSTLNGPQDAFVAKILPPRAQPVALPAEIVFATFLGGSQEDYGNSIAIDGKGAIYIAGSSNSPDFPAKQSLRQYAGGIDAFLTRMTADGGALLFSTLLGGAGDDPAFSVCVDLAGSVYLLGTTTSSNFPVCSPFQKDLNGTAEDIFVTKILEKRPSLIPVLTLLLNDD